MITTEDIKNVIEKRGNAREHLMFILRDLENLSGKNQLDIDTLTEVAELTNIPRSAIGGFVGFYTMFKTNPRAPFIVRVCKSGPCHVMGARTIFDHIEKYLGIKPGEATSDGLFYLEKCECLGVCSVAPAMMINYDIHGNLTQKKIKEIFDGYRSKKPIFGEECGPEVEGKACIINDNRQTKRLLEKVGKIDPLNNNSYVENGGSRAIKKAIREYTSEEVINIIKDSGLRGRGGAGFPTGLKLSFMPKGGIQKYIICNADEGEPGTYKDRILMEENPCMILEGMLICAYATGATVGYIYVRGEFRRAIERLQKAIDQARERRMLGKHIAGPTLNFDVFIKEGGGAYVCGEESSLINSMEGRRGYPRFRPPFPAGSGFMNLPSNVNNVETYASIPMIIEHGADWYRSVGTEKCPGTKLYCLSGKMKRVGLVELPMGTTLREIIDVYGKGIRKGKSFKFAQVGGTAGGILGSDLLDLPLDIDHTMQAGVTLGSGVVLVCDEDTCAVDFLLNILSFFEHESCGQCVPCRVGTSHLHYLAKKFAMREAVPKDIDAMIDKAQLMKKASLCALGQSPVLPITTILKYFRDEFVRHCDPGYTCPECDRTIKRFYR
ncbi:MAG: NAD(P)H-dependent oxidoreductase subunit E [Syntrophorhabdaceae bacterium]|jgi:NADH-quinone oxidoreductase subunit F|nr:NAD(P)H-dependent oxidoreductase subunit E [Syntrophorhabdaceae bacterium]